MSKAFVGRVVALAGIVCGLLGLGLPSITGGGFNYADDGTSFAFLIVLLSFSSWFSSEVGRDVLAAAMGAAAFGFFLFVPTSAAFDSLGYLDSGAWLGLCTILIPIGALLTHSGEAPRGADSRPGLGLAICTVALALVVAGIWLDAFQGGPSYWNGASSGHAVGILMLVLAVLDVVVIAGPGHLPLPDLGDLGVFVAAATFGFVETPLVTSAFESFGTLGAGGWLEACAGALLIVGVTVQRSKAEARGTIQEAAAQQA